MSLIDRIFNKNKVGGEIGYFGLEKWWFREFSPEERKRIVEVYKPFTLSESKNSLVEGDIVYSSQSPVLFLTNLAGWFNNNQDIEIANKILAKSEELSKKSEYSARKKIVSKKNYKQIIDEHFFYNQQIQTYYKQRKEQRFLDMAINACKNQIEIADSVKKAFLVENKQFGMKKEDLFMPSHRGYEQLAIILEKEKNYMEAIRLCEKAKSQGWMGSWEHRIERCKNKMNKNS